MKIFSSLSFIAISFIISINSFSQEELLIFDSPHVSKRLKSSTSETEGKLLSLPFYDDFASDYSRPNSKLWSDSFVYINNSFTNNQPSVGVASFDALNEKAEIYSSSSVNSVDADLLTSKPIDLKNYTKRYLSSSLLGFDSLTDSYFELYDSVYFFIDGEYKKSNEVLYWYESSDKIFVQSGDVFVPFEGAVYDADQNLIEGSADQQAVQSEFTLNDDITISFYFQAGGIMGEGSDSVNLPDDGDSLVLEVCVPYDTAGVFVNEIAKNWIEIYNATNETVELFGYTIVIKHFDGTDSIIDSLDLANYTVAPFAHASVPVKYAQSQDSLLYVFQDPAGFSDTIFLKQSVNSDNYTQSRKSDGSPVFVSATSTESAPNQNWIRIWGDDGKRPSEFEFVSVPIESSKYLRKGFRFRFRNKISVSPEPDHARNVDVWNVDEVSVQSIYLKPYIADVAVVSAERPALNEFKTVPYSHFFKTDRRKFDSLTYTVRSFDEYERDFKLYASIKKNFGSFEEKTLLLEDVDLLSAGVYSSTRAISDLEVYDFIAEDTAGRKSASYSLKLFLQDKTTLAHADYRDNDTVKISYDFDQYYAYDDGSSEAGYGLKGGQLSKAAIRFNALRKDTLRGVYMHLNPTNDNKRHTINLMVWEYNNGLPGELIMADYGVPLLSSDVQNGFRYYEFEPDTINPNSTWPLLEGKFFIGWQQTKEFMINIGVDLNTVVKQKLFYTFNNEWERSAVEHPLMVRPVFGDEHTEAVAVHDKGDLSESLFDAYPVPADNYVNISLAGAEADDIQVKVYSVTGQLVYQRGFERLIDVSSWKDGVYYIQIQSSNCLQSKQIVVKH